MAFARGETGRQPDISTMQIEQPC